MEYLALWMWFTSTVAVCRPAASIDELINVLLLLGVRWLSIIPSQREVLQIKQSTLEMQISDTSIGLFC